MKAGNGGAIQRDFLAQSETAESNMMCIEKSPVMDASRAFSAAKILGAKNHLPAARLLRKSLFPMHSCWTFNSTCAYFKFLIALSLRRRLDKMRLAYAP